MESFETITMNLGKNLSSIFSILGIRNKTAADEIGISYNTLSNIINQKFSPSNETLEKIKSFVEKKGFDTSMLYRSEKIVRNFRLRINSPLSGNEKAALRNSLIRIEKLLTVLDDIEHNKHLLLSNYFDKYDFPYSGISDFYACERLDEFRKIIEEKRTVKQWADYFLFPKDKDFKDFWGNLYYGVGTSNAFHINYIVECLGIRLHFMSFGTEKVKSCSTAISSAPYCPENTIWAEPSIIINTDVCDCAETCLFAMAEEFFHMIAHREDYSLLNTNEFVLENAKKAAEAEKFAMEVLLPKNKMEKFLEKKEPVPIHDVTYLKNQLEVSYKTLIKRFSQLNLCTVTEQDYLDALEMYYCDANDKLNYQNSEPEPLPLSYRGNDFFDSALLAAHRKELISLSELTECLNCTESDIAVKLKSNENSIREILQEET